jgi:hypothetical protein
VVITGCDPSLGLIADLLPTRGQRAVPVHATTTDARSALAGGRCHAALVHGRVPRLPSATRSRAGAWA